MANSQSRELRQVIVKMRPEFVDEIDEALAQLGVADRATFIRGAVYDQLRRLGFDLPPNLKGVPSRKGKGGRSKAAKKKQTIYAMPDNAAECVAEEKDN